MNAYYLEQAKKMSEKELDQFINMAAEPHEKQTLISLSLEAKTKAVAEILDEIVEETEED